MGRREGGGEGGQKKRIKTERHYKMNGKVGKKIRKNSVSSARSATYRDGT